MLNKRSKTTNVSCLDMEGRNVTDNNEIAQSMNDFFCSVSKKLSDDIPQQPSPLLSNEYNITSMKKVRVSSLRPSVLFP